MNSITYLDSLLSRSLQGSPRHSRRPSSSGSGAGDGKIASQGFSESSERRRSRRTASSGTAAAASSIDDKERIEVLQEALGSQSGKVTRRASDYSLRRGEKERRKAALALGLGLTPARPNECAGPDRGASSPSPATEAVAETPAANYLSSAVGSEKAREASSRNARQSASEGAYSRRSLDDGGRPALPRRSFRPAGPTRWATLWGLPISGWLTSASRGAEDGRRPSRSADRRSDEEGKDDLNSQRGLARRASSGSLHLGRWRAELEMEAELRADAFAGLGLSEAEAEDVVDFEGGEPESDDDAPTAPPVTPATGALSPSSSYQPQRSRRVSSQSSAGQGPRREGSESARLASFLFGALASRVDDYFGPQPSQPLARQSPAVTPSGAPTSSPPRVRRVKQDASVSNLVPVPPSFEHSAASRELNSEVKKATANGQPPGPDEPALVDTNALTEAGSPDDPKVLPIPSYSEAEKDAHMSGVIGAGPVHSAEEASAADVGPTEPLDPPPPYTAPVESSSPPIATRPLSTLRRGFGALRRALNALRRALIALLLLPYHVLRHGWMRIRRQRRDIGTDGTAASLVPVLDYESAALREGSPAGSAREKNISFAQQEKHLRAPSSSVAAGKQRVKDDESGARPPTPGVKTRSGQRRSSRSSSSSASEDSSSGDEPVTEDQAAEKAARRAERLARRVAVAAEEERSLALAKAASVNEQHAPPGTTTGDTAESSLSATRSSRLLPNPHPVDPMLTKEPKAKRVSGRHPNLDIEKSAAASGATSPTRNPSTVIHHTPKVLVLDLDETLIHSTSRSPTWQALRAANGARGGKPASISTGGSLLGLEGLGSMLGLGERGVRPHQVEVILDGRSVIYHVYKRPYVDYFLRKVASWYHVVIFTASVQEYADPVIDWLDQGRGLVSQRLFREACTFRNGSYLKDLSIVDSDLSRVCLVDNSPASYLINPANGIPIEGWTNDPNDECLLDLLPLLDALRFASDVRNVLSIRGF